MPCFSHPPSSRPSHSAYCLSRASAGIRLAPDPMRCQARPAAVRLRHRGGRGQAREEDDSHDAGGCRARGETVAVIVCVVERSPAASAASPTPSPPPPRLRVICHHPSFFCPSRHGSFARWLTDRPPGTVGEGCLHTTRSLGLSKWSPGNTDSRKVSAPKNSMAVRDRACRRAEAVPGLAQAAATSPARRGGERP